MLTPYLEEVLFSSDANSIFAEREIEEVYFPGRLFPDATSIFVERERRYIAPADFT